MKQKIRDFYQNTLSIKDEKVLDFLTENSELVKIKKRSTLYRVGDIIEKMYFYYSGFYYGFSPKTANRKLISCIAHMPGLPLIPGSEVRKQIAIHEVFVPVDSEFIVTDFEIVEKAIQMSENAKDAYIYLLQACFKHQSNIQVIRSLPTMDRIAAFFEDYKQCVPYMTNTEIAAFLDISRSEYTKAFKQAQISYKEG